MNVQLMQDIAQRREASLQYYREQYDSSHPRGSTPSSSSSSSAARQAGSQYPGPEGEDEIDCAVVRGDIDDVDAVQNCLTRAAISPSHEHIWVTLSSDTFIVSKMTDVVSSGTLNRTVSYLCYLWLISYLRLSIIVFSV